MLLAGKRPRRKQVFIGLKIKFDQSAFLGAFSRLRI